MSGLWVTLVAVGWFALLLGVQHWAMSHVDRSGYTGWSMLVGGSACSSW